MYKEDVLAAAYGVVEFVGWYYGLTIAIDHGNNYYTYYSHLNAVQPGISVGTFVEAGQLIGESGDSGSEGSWHLHFGVRHGANWDDGGCSTDPFGWRGSGEDPLVDYSGESASCLWAGAPGDEISCADIIVEDDGAGWMENGSWTESSAGNGYRQHWTYTWDPADSVVNWRPWYNQIRYAGYYQIHAFIPTANSTTINAHYKIYHSSGAAHRYVNQNNSNHFWADLGTYHLIPGQTLCWVSMDDYTGEASWSKQIVADAMKFSADIVYLPHVKNSDGRTTPIVIRNNSASSAYIAITYHNNRGGRVEDDTATILVNGSESITPPSGFSGSAVVVASEDVSVVVRDERYDEISIYNGISASGGSPGWEQVGTTLYAPVVKHNLGGRYSRIRVLNAGGSSTTVYAYFYEHDTGAYKGYLHVSDLAPDARHTFDAADKCPASSYCSVRLWSSDGQPLAAMVIENDGSGGARSMHNAFAAAATTNYVPLYKNQYYGQTGGIAVMNTSSSAADVAITYYDANSANTYTRNDTIQPWAVEVFMGVTPAGFVGSAVIVAGQPVVSALYESGGERYKATDTFLAGSETLYAPELDTTGQEASGVSIQNAGASAATVTVHYYHGNGASAGTRGPYTMAVGEVRILNNFNGGVPTNLDGSAWIESTNGIPVAAVVHRAGPGSGDTQATYNGSAP